MRSSTRSLINALRVLDSEIQSDDGVANAVIAESAQRLEEQRERIKRLEEAGDELAGKHLFAVHTYDNAKKHVAEWYKAKEAKP